MNLNLLNMSLDLGIIQDLSKECSSNQEELKQNMIKMTKWYIQDGRLLMITTIACLISNGSQLQEELNLI